MPKILGSDIVELSELLGSVTLQCMAPITSSVEESDFAWVQVQQGDLEGLMEGASSCNQSSNDDDDDGGVQAGVFDGTAWINSGSSSFNVSFANYGSGGYFVCIINSTSYGSCSSPPSTVAGEHVLFVLNMSGVWVALFLFLSLSLSVYLLGIFLCELFSTFIHPLIALVLF